MLTDAEVLERIAALKAKNSRLPVIGWTESTENVSGKVLRQLHAPGDGCFYLPRVS